MDNKNTAVNAVILAAGFASRFVPLSYECHKALIKVRGEVLIERQIKQLKESGIDEIYIVVGYKKEDFYYLCDKYGVKLIDNKNYRTMNNISSVYAAKDVIKNTYICSSDNYFSENPFVEQTNNSCYSVVFSEGKTNEWCVDTDGDGYISSVTVGGENKWYMLGHVFWDESFSKAFFELLEKEYYFEDTASMLWESFFLKHTDVLKMKVKRYPADYIFEFDSLDELREFDGEYKLDSHSEIIKSIARNLECSESEITSFKPVDTESVFSFECKGIKYECRLDNKSGTITEINIKE